MGGVEGDQIGRLEAQLAVERERRRTLEAQLGNLADNDPLTDVLNRPSLENELDQHLIGCSRYGPEGTLLLIGLDGMGPSGGQDGSNGPASEHAVADESLAAVAEAMARRIRSTDIVGRWAPDEMLVLLPRAGAAGAAVVADALVALVEATGTPGRPPGSVTASIGVAPLISASAGTAGLVARARQAMTAARHRARGAWAMAEVV